MISVGTFIIVGLFFVLLSMCVFGVALFTLHKVRKISKECNERFDKIEELIMNSNKSAKELTEAISKFNNGIKTKTNENY